MQLEGINLKLLGRKKVIIDEESIDDPNYLFLQCLRCGKKWSAPYDQDTKKVVKGYWHCINGCHDKELGLKFRPLFTVRGTGE